MILIQINAEMLNGTAGPDQAVMITVLGALIESIEDVLPGHSPADALRGYWEDILSSHEQTKDVMRRWVAQEISSPQAANGTGFSVIEGVNDGNQNCHRQ